MMSYCSIHWEEYPKGMLCKFCVAGISREAVLKSRGVIPIISIKKESLQHVEKPPVITLLGEKYV